MSEANCGACKVDVRDNVSGIVRELPSGDLLAWCNDCLDKYDGGHMNNTDEISITPPTCQCCLCEVTHVDTLNGWCDGCRDDFDEYQTQVEEDIHANGG